MPSTLFHSPGAVCNNAKSGDAAHTEKGEAGPTGVAMPAAAAVAAASSTGARSDGGGHSSGGMRVRRSTTGPAPPGAPTAERHAGIDTRGVLTVMRTRRSAWRLLEAAARK